MDLSGFLKLMDISVTPIGGGDETYLGLAEDFDFLDLWVIFKGELERGLI